MTNAERQRRYIQRLKEGAGSNDLLDEAQRRIRGLEAELARLRRAATPKAAATKSGKAVPPLDPDSEVGRLKEANRMLRAKVRRMEKFYEAESARTGVMSFPVYTQIMKCLHPDQQPTPKQREEACGLFSQLWQGGDKARRKRRA